MAEGVGVDADLVGASGGGAAFEQGEIRVTTDDFEGGFGGFAVGVVYCGAVFAADVDAQFVAGGVFCPVGPAVDQGVVDFFGLAMLELLVQAAVGFRAAGEEQNAGGCFVEAVNHPQAAKLLFITANKIGGVCVPAIGQDGNSGGFVDDEQGRVEV